MATRTRRNATQQAEDALNKLLGKQEAMVTKLRSRLEAIQAEAEATRRAFAALHQVMLPGMEPEPPIGAGPIRAVPDPPLLGWDTDERLIKSLRSALALDWRRKATGASATPLLVEESENKLRLGGSEVESTKALGINDVWNGEEGSVTVHTALMYARQESCKLCCAGVPFATQERTVHYVTTVGPEYGYHPCTGVKQRDVATKDSG